MRQRPRLLEGGLSGAIYVVTRYKDLGEGRWEASEKFDVTDDFRALAAEVWASGYGAGRYDGERANPPASNPYMADGQRDGEPR